MALGCFKRTCPISKVLYHMTLGERKELKVQLQDLLDKGFIRLGVFSWCIQVLFVKKNDRLMRLYIVYTELNNRIVKINILLGCHQIKNNKEGDVSETIFKTSYYPIKIKERDLLKTTFKTR